jgi:hypothetical protein
MKFSYCFFFMSSFRDFLGSLVETFSHFCLSFCFLIFVYRSVCGSCDVMYVSSYFWESVYF